MSYEPDDWKMPVFRFLSTFGSQHLAYYLTEIVPVLADEEIAGALHVEPGSALISFDEIGYSDDNQPILHTCSYFRDDLLRLRFIRRQV
jgi:GntR family transcriptional regulator